MPVSLVQSAAVNEGYITIKFNYTVDIDTLVNANFTLANTDATPSTVSDPFETIVLSRDYDSIARKLILYFKKPLVPLSDYVVTIKDLKTPAGDLIGTAQIGFTTVDDVTPEEEEIVPVSEPVDVKDHSIKDVTLIDFDNLTFQGSSIFYVKSIKPNIEQAFQMEPSYNEGRIEIAFNETPAANFVSDEYFKVQRKKLSRTPKKWEDVDVLVTSDPSSDLVIIYIPSTDDVNDIVYGEPDRTYWEAEYKYRLRISKEIGI